jgi:hypothetical protein
LLRGIREDFKYGQTAEAMNCPATGRKDLRISDAEKDIRGKYEIVWLKYF